jgi:hypothetical protein
MILPAMFARKTVKQIALRKFGGKIAKRTGQRRFARRIVQLRRVRALTILPAMPGAVMGPMMPLATTRLARSLAAIALTPVLDHPTFGWGQGDCSKDSPRG